MSPPAADVELLAADSGGARAVASLGRWRAERAGGGDDAELVLLRDGRFGVLREYWFRQPPWGRRQVAVYGSLEAALQAVPALHRRELEAVAARVRADD